MKKSVLVLLFLSIVSPVLPALETQVVNLDAAQRESFGIETSQVQLVKQSLSKPYPSKVQVPNAQLRVVSAPLEGVVEALLVAEGESVEAGQVLVRVRSPGLLELQANYLEAHTRRQLSGEALTRDTQLYKEGIVAKRRILETRASHRELLTAEERASQTLMLVGMSETGVARLASEQKLGALLEIVAPLSGVVLEQIATAGQHLVVSDPLYRIGHLSPLWIEVHVPLDALGDIGPGSEVRITEGNLSARVITVGRMVHGTDQGVLVRAEVSEGAQQLRPGQFVEARLSLAVGSDSLRLPARAVLRVDGADFVFAERASGFELVPVNVLSRESRDVIVSGALHVGDFVVVSGTAALKAAVAAGGE